MRRGRRGDGRRPREVGEYADELGESIESSDALRLRLVLWLARSHGRTARARGVTPARATEVELPPPTVRRRRRPPT